MSRPSANPSDSKDVGKPEGGRLADAACGDLPLPDMDEAAQERPRGDHNAAGAQFASVRELDARDGALRKEKIVRFGLDQ